MSSLCPASVPTGGRLCKAVAPYRAWASAPPGLSGRLAGPSQFMTPTRSLPVLGRPSFSPATLHRASAFPTVPGGRLSSTSSPIFLRICRRCIPLLSLASYPTSDGFFSSGTGTRLPLACHSSSEDGQRVPGYMGAEIQRTWWKTGLEELTSRA